MSLLSGLRRRASWVALWLVYVMLLLQLAGFAVYRLGIIAPISGYGYPTALFVPHPVLGYHYQPDYSGWFKGGAYQDIPIETNAQGFRDAPFDPAPGDGPRVAVLGDSVVFGPGVRADERFTTCLADLPVQSGVTPRVLNLGVNSYSFGHYVAIAELDFLGARPDAVLLGITLNDFAPMEVAGPTRRMQRKLEGAAKPNWIADLQQRIARTYAVRFVRELRDRLDYALLSEDEREAYHTKWMSTVASAWQEQDNQQRFIADLERFVALSEAVGLPLAFVLFPERNDLERPDLFGEPRHLVRGLLEQRQLAYCDPYDLFARQTDFDALFLVRDSVHYTAAGHALICEAIAQCIADRGGLFTSPPVPPGPPQAPAQAD